MSDTSRKRSRKSKLVLRDCPIELETDVDLQVPVTKIPKLVNIVPKKAIQKNEPAKATTPEMTKSYISSILRKIPRQEEVNLKQLSPIKFDIKVEVEQCDDYTIQISYAGDESYDNRIEETTQKKTKSDKEVSESKKTGDSEISEKEKSELTPIILSETEILDAANKIMAKSNNIADKILDICVRNTCGHDRKGIPSDDVNEDKIQEVLDAWRTWQFRSFHREHPLFYKCYVCQKSWWYLSDFRDHIKKHVNLNIQLELYDRHECNIIAYTGCKPEKEDFHTEGLCERCGKDFESHKLDSRIKKKHYGNPGCKKIFFTCTSLKDHKASCSTCHIPDTPYIFICDICKARFESRNDLDKHLEISHIVRSDVPILGHYQNCKECFARYACSYLHICGTRGPHHECKYCFRSFSNKLLIELHMEGCCEFYKCDVCGKLLQFNCEKYEHMMTHSDKYILVSKCVKCEDMKVFLSITGALEHKIKEHSDGDPKQLAYFTKILVPKSYLFSKLRTRQESILKCMQESTQEIKKHPVLVTEEHPVLVTEEHPVLVTEEHPVLVTEKHPVLVTEKHPVLVTEEQPVLVTEEHPVLVTEKEFVANHPEIEEFIVKEEPEDTETMPENIQEPSQIVIKNEPIDDSELLTEENISSENTTENLVPEINIKQEVEDEYDIEEYESDIIKLDIDYDQLISVENEPIERSTHNEEPVNQTVKLVNQTVKSVNQTVESDTLPIIIKQESILEPEIINRKEKKVYTCRKCGFKATHKIYKEHIETNCKRTCQRSKVFLCTKCDLDFPSMKKYLAHFVNHGYRGQSCPECLKPFFTFTRLNPHVNMHIKHLFVRVKSITQEGSLLKPQYQCKKCNELVDMDDFFDHWELHINNKPSKPVDNVPSRVQGPDEVEDDVIQESLACLQKLPKECNQCHRHFNRVFECKRHIIEHLLADAYSHKIEYGELRCQMCGSGYPNREKYKEHMRDHASLPVYKCELCNRAFSDSSNFTKHKKVHNLRVFVCDLCQKKFQSKLSLSKHLEQHQTAVPIQCDACDKTFFFESSYRRHRRSFHERICLGFKCVICNTRFDSLKFKWDHMWEVHKERKNKADCPICFKSFRKYSDVKSHARTAHSTEVSVYSVKNSNSVVNIEQLFRNPTEFTMGEAETLVVFE